LRSGFRTRHVGKMVHVKDSGDGVLTECLVHFRECCINGRFKRGSSQVDAHVGIRWCLQAGGMDAQTPQHAGGTRAALPQLSVD
jgi:hypothetical protein